MKYLISYNLFIEAKLFDLTKVNPNGKSEMDKNILLLQKSEFDFSKDLIKYITLDKRINGKKSRISIDWNHDARHDIKSRIKNRTSFTSVDEFNNHFKMIINKIFPDRIKTDINKSGNYSIYDSEINLTIIFKIDINDYLSENKKIKIITLLPGRKGYKHIIKFLDI